MSSIPEGTEPLFEVVVNGEEQYSIWPADRDIPAGWHPAGKRDVKAACLAFIDEQWTDMRPLSLRQGGTPQSH